MSKTSILDKYQIRLLDAVAQNKFLGENFYLTGGTALAEFYLHHRYSEDLDFFSEIEIDTLNLDIALKKIKDNVGAAKMDFQQSFNRNLFFFHISNKIIKTEFTYFPFPRIEKGVLARRISVDSLIDIAVNKLFTIYQRTNARDYIDLFCICAKNRFKIQDLIKKAKAKFDWNIDPLQLGMRFMKAKKAKDYPRMIQKIAPAKWQKFFVHEARKLKKDIIE